MLPFVSLDAETGTGPGAVRDLETVLTQHRGVGTVSGSPSTLEVHLEGSLDGETWYSMGTSASTGPVFALTAFASFACPARFVRANVTAISGGSSPAVTVTIGSA